MPVVASLLVGIRNIHPPALALLALVEYQLLRTLLHRHVVLDEAALVGYRHVLLAVVIPVDEIPDHLRYEVSRLSLVLGRVDFVKSRRAELVAHPCIARHLAGFVTEETVRRSAGIAGSIALAYGGNVEGKNIGIADDGFRFLYILPHLAQAVSIEIQFLHELHGVVSDEIGLVADVAEIE